MKTFTITITGDCPDTVPDALILRASSETSVPLLKTQEWLDFEFLCTNVGVDVSISTRADMAIKRLPDNDQLALEISKAFNNGSMRSSSKIEAIKELRARSNGLGLKEAKTLIDKYWDDCTPF